MAVAQIAVDRRAAEAAARARVGAARARADTARVAQIEAVTERVRNVVRHDDRFYHLFSVVARDVEPANVRVLRLFSP